MIEFRTPSAAPVLPNYVVPTHVLPGETIPTEPGFMKGHGSLLHDESELTATVSGTVERINKLVSVRAVHSRYHAENGDVVVGRVVEVAQSRWRLDINSRQHASLLLASINLTGTLQQRRRTQLDELEMRKYFRENDVVSAEVHSVYADGSVQLHSRSNMYNKLSRGQLVKVPPALIVRSKSHFVRIGDDVEVVLGMNGFIWIGTPPTRATADAAAKNALEEFKRDDNNDDDNDNNNDDNNNNKNTGGGGGDNDKNDPKDDNEAGDNAGEHTASVTLAQRINAVRVANVVRALARAGVGISADALVAASAAALAHGNDDDDDAAAAAAADATPLDVLTRGALNDAVLAAARGARR